MNFASNVCIKIKLTHRATERSYQAYRNTLHYLLRYTIRQNWWLNGYLWHEFHWNPSTISLSSGFSQQTGELATPFCNRIWTINCFQDFRYISPILQNCINNSPKCFDKTFLFSILRLNSSTFDKTIQHLNDCFQQYGKAIQQKHKSSTIVTIPSTIRYNCSIICKTPKLWYFISRSWFNVYHLIQPFNK